MKEIMEGDLLFYSFGFMDGFFAKFFIDLIWADWNPLDFQDGTGRTSK